jgi:hypothetical protein
MKKRSLKSRKNSKRSLKNRNSKRSLKSRTSKRSLKSRTSKRSLKSRTSKRSLKVSNFNKNKDENKDENVLFVFYTLDKGEYWTYPQFPKGWWMVGSGTTSPINAKKKMIYKLEEQFNGPKENTNEMKILLNKKFKDLQNKGIVKIFKIEDHYNP